MIRGEREARRRAFLAEVGQERSVSSWNHFAEVAPLIEAEHRG